MKFLVKPQSYGYPRGTMKHQTLQLLGISLALTGTGLAQKVIPNHAIANLVLGQTDFVTGTNPPVTSSFSLDGARCVAIDPVSQKVFVAQASDGGRVLRFPSASALTNGAGAEAVFGKSSFSDTTVANGTQGLSSIRGISLDRKGRLWVADASNNRVLCYEAAVYRSSHPNADRVFGQPDFTTTTAGTTAAKMEFPEFALVDSADRLWVTEFSNHRVLRFDAISTKASGASANGVLGQVNFTSGGAGTGAGQMLNPTGLAVSSNGTLFVAEGNNRVTRFANAATLANGANATGVLGQLDFTTTASGLTQSKLDSPDGLWFTPAGELWVADTNNNRVLRFNNAETIPSGSPASGVVGQPNFTTATDGTSNRAINIESSIVWPTVDSVGNLWLADVGNNRVLRFPPDVTLPLLTVAPVPPKTTTKKSQLIKGTASDLFGISKVQYRINGGTVKNATGTTTWQFTAPLKLGKNTIIINAVDSVGNVSLTRTIKIKRL
jgi:sugar lactone lactonase YvrE